jgi:hypothetical protein
MCVAVASHVARAEQEQGRLSKPPCKWAPLGWRASLDLF